MSVISVEQRIGHVVLQYRQWAEDHSLRTALLLVPTAGGLEDQPPIYPQRLASKSRDNTAAVVALDLVRDLAETIHDQRDSWKDDGRKLAHELVEVLAGWRVFD